MKYQELLNLAGQGQLDGQKLFEMRLNLIKQIEELTGRPLIIYAAKLAAPREAQNQIVLDDLLGFADLIENIDGDCLDVLIESPGGIVEAAQRIVYLLRQKFKSIRFMVPGSAYSAATMICLSGDEVLMDERSSLGPIDPQINGIPARSIINGFSEVQEKLQKLGPSALPAFLPLIQKYDLHILEICKDAEERGKQVVQQWLEEYMFADAQNANELAKNIVAFFSDYNTHKSHSRPIFMSEAAQIGVRIRSLKQSPNIQDKVWDLYLCIKFLLDSTNQFKIFENSRGVNWGKQIQVQGFPLPINPPNTPKPHSQND